MSDNIQSQNEMAKAYDPSQVEDKWYAYWMEKGYFKPKIDPAHGTARY